MVWMQHPTGPVMSEEQYQEQIRAIDEVSAMLNTPDRCKAWLVAAGISTDETDERYNTKEKADAFLESQGFGKLKKKSS